jgi:hypothetical protein
LAEYLDSCKHIKTKLKGVLNKETVLPLLQSATYKELNLDLPAYFALRMYTESDSKISLTLCLTIDMFSQGRLSHRSTTCGASDARDSTNSADAANNHSSDSHTYFFCCCVSDVQYPD